MRNKTGQVLIELAIILPLLLVLILGIFDLGRYMYTKNTLNNAARSGARVAAVTSVPQLFTQSGVPLIAPTTEPGVTIRNSLTNGIGEDSVVYDLSLFRSGAPSTGPAQAGDLIQVKVTLSNFHMISPYLYGDIAITGEAAMRYE